MAYKLRKGVYQVKCGEPRCSFDTKFEVTDNVMGMTREDVASEAKKIARGMATIKHDAIFGNKHKLKVSQLQTITFLCDRLGSI